VKSKALNRQAAKTAKEFQKLQCGSPAPGSPVKLRWWIRIFPPLATWRLCGSVFAVVLGFAIAPTIAQEDAPRTLIPGKGSDLTTMRCATCHDARHITRAKLSRGQWEDNVQNMKERGAPMAAHEMPIIVEYLATYYASDRPAPDPDPSAAAYGVGGGNDPVAKLLNAHACMACHTVDQRVVGPSFREVAAKFSGDAGAAALLAKKVREGGSGAWGSVPMPPHPQVPDADLNQMVAWILQQK
jgi:cytochrome c551/c552